MLYKVCYRALLSISVVEATHGRAWPTRPRTCGLRVGVLAHVHVRRARAPPLSLG